jgi:hypothetical protein
MDFLAVAQRGLQHILPLERSLLPREADSCGPAVTKTRPVMRASMSTFASFMSRACIVILRPPICAEYTSAPSIVMMNVFGVSLPSTPA